ncbi:hypothetical protein CPB86DRAFT_779347 [Serendipita vermifera]|nr:hypothetical protein CPB86DRAFT_779347 [Serendipita vermifera]
MNKTTSTGRGGGGNSRTFVVEEGTFERVMEYEAGKIKELKEGEVKRKTVSLRGGATVPIGKENNKEISPIKTQLSVSSDEHSNKSLVSRFPRVPSLNGNFFSREKERPPSPTSTMLSRQSNALGSPTSEVVNSNPDNRHCPTCQCWRHTLDTQARPDSPYIISSSPPPSPFRAVFPGVLLYVPEENQNSQRPTSSSSSIYPYYRERPPSPEARKLDYRGGRVLQA